MKRIIGRVFEEDDYSVFRRLPDNRDVLSNRINKLIASMTERYITNPIIVNERMEVIDGQGRFEARKALKKPIHYIVVNGATSADCRRMNKYNTKWTILDFAKSYAKSGIRDYVLLLNVCNETKLSISNVLRLSGHGGKTRKPTDSNLFEKGKLNFTEEDAQTVNAVNKMANEIQDALQFSQRPNDAFRTGIKIVSETKGYDHSKMIRNCKQCRSSYAQMSSLKDQLLEFERIYNKYSRDNGKLYFSDYMRNKGSSVRNYGGVYTPYEDDDQSTLLMNEVQ